MQGAIYCHPEKFILSPMWDNIMISRNGKPLKHELNRELSSKIVSVSDLFDPESGVMLTKNQIETTFGVDITNDFYLEIKYILKNAKRALGLPGDALIQCFRPMQPLLIHILNLVDKGCSLYYRYLRKNKNLIINLRVRESKWHEELNCTFGPQFWSNVYSTTAAIRRENKLKWMQFQINRNSLFTNYKISKFSPHVSPYCSFCSRDDSQMKYLELVSHLFYDCLVVNRFWQELRAWFSSVNPPVNIPLSRNCVLFGILTENCNSLGNFVILCGKYYIWKTKLQSGNILFNSFKMFLKIKLEETKNALFLEDKMSLFDIWLVIFDLL